MPDTDTLAPMALHPQFLALRDLYVAMTPEEREGAVCALLMQLGMSVAALAQHLTSPPMSLVRDLRGGR